MRPADDSFGDEHDAPMDRAGLVLLATAWLASWAGVWGVWRACVAAARWL